MLDSLERNGAAVGFCLQQISDLAGSNFRDNDIAGRPYECDRPCRVFDDQVTLTRLSGYASGNVPKRYRTGNDMDIDFLYRVDRRHYFSSGEIKACTHRSVDLDALARETFRARAGSTLGDVADPQPVDLS